MFFSDAVFAIAITLLVIDLRLPSFGRELSDAELADALRALVPRVFAYVLSFTVIGIYWHGHWSGFRHLRRVDERLVLLNLALLGCVAIIPFPTSLMGEYGDRPLAVIVYAVALSLAGVLGPFAWLHAESAGLVDPATPAPQRREGATRAFLLPAVMLASLVLLPLGSTWLVEIIWFSLVPLEMLVGRRAR